MASRVAVPGTKSGTWTFLTADYNNLPGGSIGYAEITADSNQWNTTATSITGLLVTVTVNSNRRLCIHAQGVIETGAAANVCDLYLWRDVSGASPLALIKRRFGGGSGLAQATFTIIHQDDPSSGSHTYNLKGDRVTGVVNQYVTASTDASTGYGPAWIEVFDCGPAY